MEILEFLVKRNVLTGLAIGIGATLLAPALVPAITRVGKPAAKTVMKAGLVAYERSREIVAEVGESVEDLYAEAKAELSQQAQKAAEQAPAAPTGAPG